MAESEERCPCTGWLNTTSDWGLGGSIWNDSALITRLNTVLFTVLFFIHVFDCWSTAVILLHGGAEWNPVVLWFMHIFGTYAGLVLIKSYTIFLSGLLVRAYIDSPVVSSALALVIVCMAAVLLSTNVPIVYFIYGGT